MNVRELVHILTCLLAQTRCSNTKFFIWKQKYTQSSKSIFKRQISRNKEVMCLVIFLKNCRMRMNSSSNLIYNICVCLVKICTCKWWNVLEIGKNIELCYIVVYLLLPLTGNFVYLLEHLHVSPETPSPSLTHRNYISYGKCKTF